MGTWGTAISSNDAFADIYSEFIELYNDGGDPAEITRKLIRENQEMIDIPEENHDLWFAIALAQWECKRLEPEVLKTVSRIIESGKDLEIWRESGADEKDIRKRETVLAKFLEKLSSEKPKARARKVLKVLEASFEKGTLLTFKLGNGNFGGAVVLEAVSGKGFAYNLVAVTRINKAEMPTADDFARAEVLLLNYASWDSKPAINWIAPIKFAEDKGVFEPAGQIAVSQTYDTGSTDFGFCGSWTDWTVDLADLQFEFEKENRKPEKGLKIADLTKNRWWKLW